MRREETHKRVMLGGEKTPIVAGHTTVDNSALAARKNDCPREDTSNNRRNRNLWCDHNQRSNHSHEKCWRLNGKPPNFRDNRGTRREPKGYQTTSDTEQQLGENFVNISLNKEQLEQLYKLLTPSSASVPAQSGTNTSQNLINSSFVAQKGTFRTALSGTTEKFNPWIIDSGATDHMTGFARFFSTYTPGCGHIKVKIANGSLATVVGTGAIILRPHITLFNVLHVPKLSCNLVLPISCLIIVNFRICLQGRGLAVLRNMEGSTTSRKTIPRMDKL